MTENMKKFLDAVASDENLQQEINEILALPESEQAEAAVHFAQKYGFEFKEEDLADEELELSDEALDGVAGGHPAIVAGLVVAGILLGTKKVH